MPLLAAGSLKKALGILAECWPSLRNNSSPAPCQQQVLFPPAAGWQHLRILGYRCLAEHSAGYEFMLKLESPSERLALPTLLELQPQNSYSQVALWLTRLGLSGCQTVQFAQQRVPLCQALSCIDLTAASQIPASALSDWLASQPRLTAGRFQVLESWETDDSLNLHCVTTDCMSRACYHWLQQQAIRYQLLYLRFLANRC
ncbi:hypothetical protein [Alishewanella sp. HH-ZS]|uniref:hypothetical protein n=1 Tax=Alishewanella sp. HH-ZS TaxID=1856684 RepID=UPI000823739D|nr:hypothetical protein [Alishewanella sp. HH-ZS]OCW96404.1 hypothetical protein A9165_11925 [Alishewanella sp. HH-ZS]